MPAATNRKPLTALLSRILPVTLAAVTMLAYAASKPARTTQQPVSLYVTVEKDGGLVSGLTERNFRLYEDGEHRAFELATPEAPSLVALLVEHSRGSWIYWNDIQSAMLGFMHEFPEGPWYALATFDNTLKVHVDFTKRHGRILQSFQDLGQPFRDDVNTYDAVVEMLDKMDRLPGRRILILIGSGIDTFSAHTLDEVQQRAEEVNAVIFGVAAGSALRGQYEPYMGSSTRLTLLQAEAFHRMLAETTGGESWAPRFESAFRDVMKGIVQTLAHQYRLVYSPRPARTPELRKIEVQAFQVTDDRREDFKVRVRKRLRQ